MISETLRSFNSHSSRILTKAAEEGCSSLPHYLINCEGAKPEGVSERGSTRSTDRQWCLLTAHQLRKAKDNKLLQQRDDWHGADKWFFFLHYFSLKKRSPFPLLIKWMNACLISYTHIYTEYIHISKTFREHQKTTMPVSWWCRWWYMLTVTLTFPCLTCTDL